VVGKRIDNVTEGNLDAEASDGHNLYRRCGEAWHVTSTLRRTFSSTACYAPARSDASQMAMSALSVRGIVPASASRVRNFELLGLKTS